LRILPLASLLGTLLLADPCVVVAQPALTREADLPRVYEREIAAFWAVVGKRHDFSGVDNIRIASMSFQRPGSDKGIVISNGRTESFIKYKEVVYDLWHAGYSVYVFDHRGQGFSGRILQPASEGSSSEAKRAQREIGAWFRIGHSWVTRAHEERRPVRAGFRAWFRIGHSWVTRAHEERRPVRAGFRHPMCPVREAASLPLVQARWG